MREMRDRAVPTLLRLSSTTSVGYPGRDGAHSAAACDRLFPGGAELVALPSFSAVADAAAEGSVEFGVLPIESSLSGPVAETHDLLYDSSLAITGETVLPIRHCLVGPAEVRLEEIRVVRSHPVALDQCRQLLAAMPWATAMAAATTASTANRYLITFLLLISPCANRRPGRGQGCLRRSRGFEISRLRASRLPVAPSPRR